MTDTHTHTHCEFGWLCRQHLFCALSSSLCTPPSVTGGRDSDSRSRETHKHTKLTKTQKPLTHGECFAYPQQYTHTCCGAVPCGAMQAERHTACLHHLLGMRDERHTYSRWMYIKPFNHPGSWQGQSFLFSMHNKPVHQSAFVHPPDRQVCKHKGSRFLTNRLVLLRSASSSAHY